MLGNLPKNLTPFVGRRRELKEIRRLLVSTRVLTLLGIGGVGKTRLATAVAADRRRAFPDGTWYIRLEGTEENQLIVAQVADMMGHRHDKTDADLTISLVRSLANKHLLLVLDNCEHVIDETAHLINAIVRDCPHVRILATSRTPLPAAGYVSYSVPPLSKPASLEKGSENNSDAVKLFIECARRTVPDFAVTAENRSDIYNTLERLDYLPLAIELAAARLQFSTIRQIADHLSKNRTMLDWGDDKPDLQQQTIRAILQWTSDLCPESERTLWARLSVFRGSFDIDAAERVCHTSTIEDILDLIEGLVERSILTREDHGVVVRYSMLEVIRNYGYEILNASIDSISDLRERHMAWYFELINRAEAEWNTGRQSYWLRTLPLDHKNIIFALSTASENFHFADAAAISVCGLWRYYWWACGWLSEGLYWVDRCSRPIIPTVLRARLTLLGSLLSWTTGGSRSEDLLAEGEAAAQACGDSLSLALVEHVRGDAALYRGDPRAAVDHFRRALTTYGNSWANHRVDSLLMLTLACATLRDVEGAEAAHLEVLFTLDPAEQFQRSYSLLYIGYALHRGRLSDQSLAAVRDALRLKSELNDPFGIAWVFEIVAEIYCDAKKFDTSSFLLGASSRLWKTMAIERSILERLQIRENVTRERVRSRLSPSVFADHYHRGESATLGAAIDAALNDRQAPRVEESHISLTNRESEIAVLVAEGLTNKQIATKLVIAQRTADAYVQNVLTKLGFNSRAQIARWVNQLNS